MKGGQKPIHIMRWAAADFVNDPVVKLALARRDYAAIVLYVLVLNWSHIEGGDVPADVEALAAVIGMPKAVVERALPFWLNPPIDKPKLFIEETCLYNGRVRREVHEELAFRDEQSKRGAEGAKRRWNGGRHSQRHQGANGGSDAPGYSPPSPTPVPAPTPQRHDRGDVPSLQRDVDELIREVMALTGEKYDEVLWKASSVNNGPSMASVENCTSERWLRTTKGKLIGLRVAAQKPKAPEHPTETPEERARRRLKTGTDE